MPAWSPRPRTLSEALTCMLLSHVGPACVTAAKSAGCLAVPSCAPTCTFPRVWAVLVRCNAAPRCLAHTPCYFMLCRRPLPAVSCAHTAHAPCPFAAVPGCLAPFPSPSACALFSPPDTRDNAALLCPLLVLHPRAHAYLAASKVSLRFALCVCGLPPCCYTGVTGCCFDGRGRSGCMHPKASVLLRPQAGALLSRG